jgi:hypothetical protein
MRTNQEIIDHARAVLQRNTDQKPAAQEERRKVIPGKRYREKGGCIVTVLRSSDYRVVYQREGYSGESELSRYWFDRKFTEVK